MGSWTCPCENTDFNDGFCPVNEKNEEVEPTPQDWTTNHFACFRCGRIIDVDSLDVVRQVPFDTIKALI